LRPLRTAPALVEMPASGKLRLEARTVQGRQPPQPAGTRARRRSTRRRHHRVGTDGHNGPPSSGYGPRSGRPPRQSGIVPSAPCKEKPRCGRGLRLTVRHLKSPVSPSNPIHNADDCGKNADDCGKNYEGSGTEIVNASSASVYSAVQRRGRSRRKRSSRYRTTRPLPRRNSINSADRHGCRPGEADETLAIR
jgi:hypothetical protein